MNDIKIVMKAVGDLKPADYNPRTIAPEMMRKLRKGLAEFGFVEPIVVNSFPGRENVVVGGHQRLQAAIEEGFAEVPCNIVYLDPAKEKVLNVALNKLSGEWDFAKLSDVLAELKGIDDLDFDLSGFDDVDLSAFEAATQEALDDFVKNGIEPNSGTDETGALVTKYEVLISVNSETEQVELLNEMLERGLKCRALTL